MASAILLQLKVAHDIVTELVSVLLFSGSSHHLEFVELSDLVIIVFESEDRSVHRGVSGQNDPVLSANAKSRIHCL